MNRTLSLGSLLVLSGTVVVGCTGDRCLSDDVDCIVDHMVLTRPVDNGPRVELIKTDSTALEPLIPAPPCAGKVCFGSCVSLDVDEKNCGACSTACSSGQRCVNGACVCPAGETVCNGACVDLKTSGTSCGMCGHSCTGPMGSTSSSSASASSSTSSSAGSTSSSAGSASSSAGSGSGGAGGASSSASSASSSTSGAGGASSSGSGAGGADGFYCSAGVCVTDCSAPRTACGQACVDTQTDAGHCGDCNTACAVGETCQAGVCTCTSPPTACGCVDLSKDGSNCGTCGTVCAPDQACQAGICWPPPPDPGTPLAITSRPIPLVFTDPSVLVRFDLAFRDPNACAPSFCTEVCEGDKCSSRFACTREAPDTEMAMFRSFIGFLAKPRGSDATFTMQTVPFSAPGCPSDLLDQLATGNTKNVTVGALARIPVKLSDELGGSDCTSPTNLCGCSLTACSGSDGACSYEVNGTRIPCGDNCDCAVAISTATKMCCPTP